MSLFDKLAAIEYIAEDKLEPKYLGRQFSIFIHGVQEPSMRGVNFDYIELAKEVIFSYLRQGQNLDSKRRPTNPTNLILLRKITEEQTIEQSYNEMIKMLRKDDPRKIIPHETDFGKYFFSPFEICEMMNELVEIPSRRFPIFDNFLQTHFGIAPPYLPINNPEKQKRNPNLQTRIHYLDNVIPVIMHS